MKYPRFVALACLGLFIGACGAPTTTATSSPPPSATSTPTATATATPSDQATSPPSVILPTFSSAQQAATYSVEEWIILNKEADGDHSATIYAAGSCTPTAQRPCLTGGAVTMGDHAAYGQFNSFSTGGGAVCFGYVFEDGFGWHSMNAACVQNAVNPVRGQADIVNVSGGCANVRQVPGLSGKVLACLSNGTEVQIDDGPNFVANGAGQLGYLWWHLAGKGWMAHQFLLALPATPCAEPQCALQPATCPSAYGSSATLTGAGAFHSTTIYDNFDLPPLTRKLENNAAGFRGTMLCSGGTLAEVTAFTQVELATRGFHYTGATGCAVSSYAVYECWSGGASNKYDFVLGFNSATDWFAGFHNPDNLG